MRLSYGLRNATARRWLSTTEPTYAVIGVAVVLARRDYMEWSQLLVSNRRYDPPELDGKTWLGTVLWRHLLPKGHDPCDSPSWRPLLSSLYAEA